MKSKNSMRYFGPGAAWLAGLLLVLSTLAGGACSSSDAPAVGTAAGAAPTASAGASGAPVGGGTSAASAGASAGTTASSAGSGGTPVTQATLSGLAPNVGALIPIFNPTVTSYSLRVPSGTSSVALTPTASATTTAITINDAAVASGAASASAAVPADAKLTFTVKASGAAPLADTTYNVTLSVQAVPTHVTIQSVGDSTMADYQISMYPNQRGWMQLFPKLVKGDVQVVNAGLNGASSKSFYRSTRWDAIKARILPGDYMFIQFGHNDEKDRGIEGASGVGTAPWGAYHENLTKFVTETKALGGIPILFTPVVRLDWSGTQISPTGSHDLTVAGAAADDGNYPAAMRDVAQKLGCPLIDLTLLSKALVEQYGPTRAKADLYIAADNTHLQPMGAASYAQLAAQELIKQGILSAQLQSAFGLTLSDAALQFDQRYVGSTVPRWFSAFGLGLEPASGSVLVSAPTGFLVSTGSGTPSATVELPYTLGALPPNTVQVSFVPTAPTPYAGTLSVEPGTGSAQTVALNGTGLPVPAGATEIEVRYPLDAVSTTTCSTLGGAVCAPETFAGLYVKDYSSLTLLTPTPNPIPAQRVTILSTPVANTWPLETAVNPARYAQFTLAAAAGKSASIDTVSLYTGSGNTTLSLRVSYSTKADFSAPVDLFDAPDNDANVIVFRSASPLPALAPGETFYVRVYPFSKTDSTLNSLSLLSVVIHGVSY